MSDNPLAQIWRELQRYAGLQRARRLFKSGTDDHAIRNFCAYVELADSYSSLAEDADATLDPLLMYYAAMWLSRALIAVKLGIDVAKSLKAHGARPLPAAGKTLKVLSGSIEVHRRGTLPTLIYALGGNVASGQTFKIVDLLRAIPELDHVLQDTIGERTSAIKVFPHPEPAPKLASVSGHQMSFEGVSDPADVSGLPIAAALKARGAKMALVPASAIIWYSGYHIEDELATLLIRTHDGLFAETRIDGSYMPELAIYLAVLHALSEFTRYYPRDWLDVYADHGDDYSIIREFMDSAERKVPELVLGELTGQKTLYGHT